MEEKLLNPFLPKTQKLRRLPNYIYFQIAEVEAIMETLENNSKIDRSNAYF